ncbi:MAG TPA: T9SS type A sorting domain-containing protein [Candidatus Barnesiella excrementigallinarum]|nr:T9SS type A sorting domain-containing protein [Candidatus Barnesiella excrementigallinarum]
MKHLYTLLIALMLSSFGVSISVAQSSAANEVWMLDNNSRQDNRGKDSSIEISSKEGNIYIRTPRKVEVTIYTILGQVVITRTINPGTSELKIGARGIYLVKIEGETTKVAL